MIFIISHANSNKEKRLCKNPREIFVKETEVCVMLQVGIHHESILHKLDVVKPRGYKKEKKKKRGSYL